MKNKPTQENSRAKPGFLISLAHTLISPIEIRQGFWVANITGERSYFPRFFGPVRKVLQPGIGHIVEWQVISDTQNQHT
jgi:hypothetical protein